MQKHTVVIDLCRQGDTEVGREDALKENTIPSCRRKASGHSSSRYCVIIICQTLRGTFVSCLFCSHYPSCSGNAEMHYTACRVRGRLSEAQVSDSRALTPQHASAQWF